MHLNELTQRLRRRLQLHLNIRSFLRCVWLRFQGVRVGPRTVLGRVRLTWPHQVAVGSRCLLEDDVYFNYDGPWAPGPSIIIGDHVFLGGGCEFNICQRLVIGHDCLIASGCKFIDHNHGNEIGALPMNKQPNITAPILLEDDVWLGVNVVVLKGVTIGRGAIVGAGAVVTKPIGAYEIWAGIPARRIGTRTVGSSVSAAQGGGAR